MALSQVEIKKIVDFVKKEPCTIQDIAKHIGRAWMTANSYVEQIAERTGQLQVKTFRAGTQGALKLVYYTYEASIRHDDVHKALFYQIKNGRQKKDFDFMEIFQFVPETKKRSFIEQYKKAHMSYNQDIVSFLKQAQTNLYCFSGIMSFINITESSTTVLDAMEDLLERGVHIKILSRINLASTENLQKLQPLMKKYPNQIEIKHCYQPLRGFVIDDKAARFKDEEFVSNVTKAKVKTRIFYEVNDKEWITWLQKVFYNLFRPSIDHSRRLKEIQKIW